eukprot:4134872-Amphidinium_carterae.1
MAERCQFATHDADLPADRVRCLHHDLFTYASLSFCAWEAKFLWAAARLCEVAAAAYDAPKKFDPDAVGLSGFCPRGCDARVLYVCCV